MKPIDTQNTATIAASLGTKVSVSSWIEVSAWKSPTTSPAISATDRIGSEMITETQRPWRNVSNSTASSCIASHRHPQDFLVRLDNLVPDGDSGFHRKFGLGQGLHESMRIGLHGHGRLRRRLSLLKCRGEIPRHAGHRLGRSARSRTRVSGRPTVKASARGGKCTYFHIRSPFGYLFLGRS